MEQMELLESVHRHLCSGTELCRNLLCRVAMRLVFCLISLLVVAIPFYRAHNSARSKKNWNLMKSATEVPDPQIQSSMQEPEHQASDRQFTGTLGANILGSGLLAWVGYIPIYIFVRRQCTTCIVTSTADTVTTSTGRLTTIRISTPVTTKFTITTTQATSTPVSIVTTSTVTTNIQTTTEITATTTQLVSTSTEIQVTTESSSITATSTVMLLRRSIFNDMIGN